MRKITDFTGRLGNLMFEYAYLYSQMKRGVIADVYVQDEKYFEEFKDDIRRMFREEYKTPLPYVAIHVRRGDYVNNPFYVDLMQTDYYQRAMESFAGERFMLFSDDIDWCKKQEIFSDCIFSEGFDEVEDLNRMMNCKGVIMANSSFSWWGGYLSGGRVIAPKLWFSDGKQRTKLLDSWIQI